MHPHTNADVCHKVYRALLALGLCLACIACFSPNSADKTAMDGDSESHVDQDVSDADTLDQGETDTEATDQESENDGDSELDQDKSLIDKCTHRKANIPMCPIYPV